MGTPATVGNGVRTDEPDRDLVSRAAAGSTEAFEKIVRVYQRRVYAVALRMTRRHEVADDIVQETFVRAYSSLHRFELGRPLAPWLVRIAVNLCINYLTAAARKEEPLSDGTTSRGLAVADSDDSDPQRRLLRKELLVALDEAVDKLPPEQKAVFVLRAHQQLRYEEIAQTLGVSPGTVMSRLFRARSKLRQMLKDYL